MVLTVSFVLFPVIGLFCHRHLADTSAKLDAGVEASEPHDFAVRGVGALVLSAIRVHRIPPRVDDVAQRPSLGTGRGELVEMICPTGKAEYFSQEGWTGNSVICPSGKSREAHQADGASQPYSITSSARPSSKSGKVRPSAFAVLRLTTSSTLVDC
jgi:hypothetical protein